MRSPWVSTFVGGYTKSISKRSRNCLDAARLVQDGDERPSQPGCDVLPGCECCGATILVWVSALARERYLRAYPQLPRRQTISKMGGYAHA
jgi:hypothetical protein